MAASLNEEKIVCLDEVITIADGIKVKEPGIIHSVWFVTMLTILLP